MNSDEKIGRFLRNRVAQGDCLELAADLPDESVDVLVTSPPYWGQRTSAGMGVEEDPREYVETLRTIFRSLQSKRSAMDWCGSTLEMPTTRPSIGGLMITPTALSGRTRQVLMPPTRRT